MIGIESLGLVISAVLGGGSIFGGVIWARDQKGRIDMLDQQFEEADKFTQAMANHYTERHEDLKARLVRIEIKLDSMNGRGRY